MIKYQGKTNKNKMAYKYKHIRDPKVKNNLTIPNSVKGEEQLQHLYFVGRTRKYSATLENSLAV